MPCRPFKNPADHYMKLLQIKFPRRDIDNKKIAFFNDNYNSIIKPKLEEELKSTHRKYPPIDPEDNIRGHASMRT